MLNQSFLMRSLSFILVMLPVFLFLYPQEFAHWKGAHPNSGVLLFGLYLAMAFVYLALLQKFVKSSSERD